MFPNGKATVSRPSAPVWAQGLEAWGLHSRSLSRNSCGAPAVHCRQGIPPGRVDRLAPDEREHDADAIGYDVWLAPAVRVTVALAQTRTAAVRVRGHGRLRACRQQPSPPTAGPPVPAPRPPHSAGTAATGAMGSRPGAATAPHESVWANPRAARSIGASDCICMMTNWLANWRHSSSSAPAHHDRHNGRVQALPAGPPGSGAPRPAGLPTSTCGRTTRRSRGSRRTGT
jgi:hypothetical protein